MKKVLIVLLILTLSLSVFASGSKEKSSESARVLWKEKGTPLADKRIRMALRYAIDMQMIVDELFEGKARRAVSLTSPGSYLADGLEEYSYNPELAKKLLKEASWPKDYTLDVVYYYGDQQTVDLMAIIQQFWKEVGVKSSFRKLEGDLAAQLWVPPTDRVNGPSAVKWDIAYAAIAALAEHEFYNRFTSYASNNSSLPKQDGLDELIEKTNETANVNKQIKAFYDVQKRLNKDYYLAPLYHQLAFIYVSDKLDIKGAKLGNDQFSFEKNILDWVVDRDDHMMYTNSGPLEFYEAPMVNPGMHLYQEVLFDRLINADESLSPTDGLLAKDYSVSENGKQIVLNLRDGVKWHDGKLFSADDVRFTFEYLIKVPGLNVVALTTLKSLEGADEFINGSADSIKGIVIDGSKVTLNFKQLDPNALLTLSQWPILPSHLLKDSSATTAQQNLFWQHPIGTGPFKVSQTVLGNYAILERNKDYFKKGTGNVEKIFMHASGENDTNILKNAEAGKIDYAWNKSVVDAKGIEKLSNMKVYPVSVRYTRLFYFNQFAHEANIK